METECMCGFAERKSKDALLRGGLSAESGYGVMSSVQRLCTSPGADRHNTAVYSGESATK